MGLYALALVQYQDALQWVKCVEKYAGMEAEIYNSMGLLYQQLNNPETGLSVMKDAENIWKMLGDNSSLARIWTNIAICFDDMKAYNSALHYNLIALDLKKIRSNREDIAEGIKEHFKSNLLEIIGPVDNYMGAIDLINETRPDIALLDIALDDDLDAGLRLALYLNLGFDMAKWLIPFDFISKPVDQNQLMEKIELASIFNSQRNKVENLHPQKNSIQNQSIFVTTSTMRRLEFRWTT